MFSIDHQLWFSPQIKEIPEEERNGEAHTEAEEEHGGEGGQMEEGEAVVEAMEQDALEHEIPAEEDEVVEGADEVSEGTVIGTWPTSTLPKFFFHSYESFKMISPHFTIIPGMLCSSFP